MEAEQEFDFDFLFEFKHSDEGGGGGWWCVCVGGGAHTHTHTGEPSGGVGGWRRGDAEGSPPLRTPGERGGGGWGGNRRLGASFVKFGALLSSLPAPLPRLPAVTGIAGLPCAGGGGDTPHPKPLVGLEMGMWVSPIAEMGRFQNRFWPPLLPPP